VKRIPIVLLLLWAMAASCPAVDVNAFPFFKPLQVRGAEARPLGVFTIDEELLERTDTTFADMRVVDADGREAPFLVRAARDRRKVVTEHDIAVETLDFELLPDNRFRVLLKRKPANTVRPASVLVLKSSQQNYEKTVNVWASSDKETWRPLVADAPVYDYSKYLALSRDRVSLKPGRDRYYRVEVANIMEEDDSPLIQIAREERGGALYGRIEKSSLRRIDFKVDRFQLLERREDWSEQSVKLQPYTVADLTVNDDPDNKLTAVEFRAANVPLRELHVDVANTYFSRRVALEGNPRAEGVGGWQRVTSGTIQRVPRSSDPKDLRMATSAPCRYRRYRLTIHNQDSPPLSVEGITLRGEVHEAVFLCEPGNPYRVLYGAQGLAVPRYDIARVVSGARPGDMDVYEAGPESELAEHRGLRIGWLRSGRALLIPAAVLMVAVLIWLIVKTMKQIEPPAPDAQDPHRG